ncbi:MAG: ATP-grasp domain-containing protein [Bacteroidales bacterium]|nr:ATP-grasp domain-containing protein [Bacteroidales bacterium]
MKKLAVIGSGRMAWIIGNQARKLGIITHCFSNVEPTFIHEAFDVFHNISIFEKDKIVDICKEEKIQGVLATTELTVEIAAFVAKELNTPGLQYEVARVITDKFRNRLLCKNLHLLHQPQFTVIDNREKLDALTIAFPVIVKPTSKGGKQGITVANSKAELLMAYNYAKEKSGESPVIIEGYLNGGKEYSVESLSWKGKHYIVQVTEKISSGPPHCVELGHRQPAELSDKMRKEVEEAVKEGLCAIGLDNSPCHTEIKIIEDQVYLIEFNARPGGDHIAWPLTTLSTGYEYIEGAIKIAMGEFQGLDTSKLKQYYAGVYFITKQTEYLKPLFDDCEKYPWLYQKNYVSDELQTLEHNDCYGTNSIMYYSENERPNIDIQK